MIAKTKNFLVVAALILTGMLNMNSVMAQDVAGNTDQVKVNIRFKPIQSLVVTSGQDVVDLVYTAGSDYAQGVSSEQPDHLTVFSTGGFIVNVKTDGDFTRTDGGTIPASDVKVNALNGTGNPRNYGDGLKNVSLSSTDQPFIVSNGGGRNLAFNVKYDNTAGANDAYIDKFIAADNTESVYTANVTYTIVAQ